MAQPDNTQPDKTHHDTTDHTETDLENRLTPLQYRVTQKAGTEPAFTGEYWDTKAAGTYHCVVCDTPLFDSATKYDSGTGWPSFFEPVAPEAVDTKRDFKLLMPRTEAVCSTCGAHLGHVFPDGPQPTGDRYCMNSASLRLAPAQPGSDAADHDAAESNAAKSDAAESDAAESDAAGSNAAGTG